MQHTQNYQLSRWEKDDRIMMEDFNADNEKIDAALKANADAVGALEVGKADAEDVTALGETVAAVAAGLGSGGQNARIAWGSYTGRGTIGAANANRLDFGFQPVLVVIGSNEEATKTTWPSIFLRNVTKTKNEVTTDSTITVAWTATGLSWYATSDNPNYPGWYQNNVNGRTYYYCAIGYSNN